MSNLLKKPLPEPWSFAVTKDGRIFFINDEEKTTTWLHPVTKEAILTGYQSTPDLPVGWERGFTIEGFPYYINHCEKSTSMTHPVHSSETKKKRKPSFSGTISRTFRRRSSERRITEVSNNVGTKSRKMTVMRRSSNIRKSGWLYKQDSHGVGGIKVWRKRWFVLADFCLFYYKDMKESDVLGSIVLPSYKISTLNPDDRISRKYSFKIEHPGMRSYLISAESYGDMAEWVKTLTPLCSFQPSEAPSHNDDDDASQFGFNEMRRNRSSADTENRSSTNNRNNNNSSINNVGHVRGSHSTDSTDDTHSTPATQARSGTNGPRDTNGPHDTHGPHDNTHGPTSTNGTNSSYDPNSPVSSYGPNMGQLHSTSITHGPYTPRGTHGPHTQRDTPSTHGPATPHGTPGTRGSDVPRGTKTSSLKSKNQVAREQRLPRQPDRRLSDNSSKIGRTNSMMRLGDWVTTQRKRNSSLGNVSARPSSGRVATRGTRRYKPSNYNDYMDSMEVASSIMSVPPVYRNHRVLSLPRPRSTQTLNERGKGKFSGEMKSPLTPHTQGNPRQNHGANASSPGSYDVFSPTSSDNQFSYPTGSPVSPNIEIKQMDVKGRTGQLRAFAISVRQPNNGINAANQIEAKLKQVADLESNFHKISTSLKTLKRGRIKRNQGFNENGFNDVINKLKNLEMESKQLTQEVTSSKEEVKQSSTDQSDVDIGRMDFILESLQRIRSNIRVTLFDCEDDDASSHHGNRSPSTARSSYSLGRSSLGSSTDSPRGIPQVADSPRGVPQVADSPRGVPRDKYYTLPGRGVSHATSVDSLTAASLARYVRPNRGIHRSKSAAERLLNSSHGNLAQDPSDIKRIQREINQNRRRTLQSGDFPRKSYGSHDPVGMDVKMAIRHHRMPKVLQRAKRDRGSVKHDELVTDQPEPAEDIVDLELVVPNKVEIPDRLVDYDVIELTPEQEILKQRKVDAIERMLARSGQTASHPSVHLAAALAAEAGTVARAVAFQATHKDEAFIV